jgi:hypothetical protein
MIKWLEKRVRKAELKFIDMHDFVYGGKTGNPLRDKATREELVEYIKSRKLRLTVNYRYGDGNDKAAMFSQFTQPESGNWIDNSKYSSNVSMSYPQYTLGGEAHARANNYTEVGIVIEPGQPGSEYTGSHIGGKGAVASIMLSDYKITLDGEEVTALAFNQGQSDLHDAKPEQYIDLKSYDQRKKEAGDNLEATRGRTFAVAEAHPELAPFLERGSPIYGMQFPILNDEYRNSARVDGDMVHKRVKNYDELEPLLARSDYKVVARIVDEELSKYERARFGVAARDYLPRDEDNSSISSWSKLTEEQKNKLRYIEDRTFSDGSGEDVISLLHDPDGTHASWIASLNRLAQNSSPEMKAMIAGIDRRVRELPTVKLDRSKLPPFEVAKKMIDAQADYNAAMERFNTFKSISGMRDINTPYRETHPELMFRVAFMMAVSTDHPAMIWPTGDTIRMYEGHSTYEGNIYDERMPKYAESWLREYGARVTKQEIPRPPRSGSVDFEEEFDFGRFIDREMQNEARDVISDEFTEQDSYNDAMAELASEMFSKLTHRHEDWVNGLNMRDTQNNSIVMINGQPAGRARFNTEFYESETKDIERFANSFFEKNAQYHPGIYDEDAAPTQEDSKRNLRKAAVKYFDRFIEVNELAIEQEGTDAASAKKVAEVYVMKITPEMKAAFRETGIPMFSQAQEGDSRPIQAEDNPIPDKAWVNEMEKAIKIAAACGAAQAGAGAAFGALAAGAALGLTAAAPIASLIASEGEELRWLGDMRRRINQDRIDAGLGTANDYVDEEGNYRPPLVDDEGFVQPTLPVADGGTVLNPDRPYTAAELAAAEREIRQLSPRAIITDDNVRRQADVMRYGLRRGGEPADAPQ